MLVPVLVLLALCSTTLVFVKAVSGAPDVAGLDRALHPNGGGASLTPGAASTPPAARLQVNPASVSLVTAPGVSPSAQTVTLTNTGTATLNWTTGTLPFWVSVNPSSGMLIPGSSQTLALRFALMDTTPRTYTTRLSFQDSDTEKPLLALPITVAAATGSKTWYFADGSTGPGFTEFLALANPGTQTAKAQVIYLLTGAPAATRSYVVPPYSRFTVRVNEEVGNDKNVSLVVKADQPIVAERTMYFTSTGLPGSRIPSGSNMLGATSLSQNFAFSYLDTRPGYATFLTLLNSDPKVAMQATIQYFPQSGGSSKSVTHRIPPNSRGAVVVSQDVPPGIYGALVSLSVPGLVERSLYVMERAAQTTGAASMVGVAQPQRDWYFAEGYTSPTFHERYILFNPSTSVAATASVVFFLRDGPQPPIRVTLQPGQQQVVDANAQLGNANVENGAQISANVPILAERFMGFTYTGPVGGSKLSSIPGISDALGASSPGFLFLFAEGDSGPQFAEYLAIANPNPVRWAAVTVTCLPVSGARPVVRRYTVAPGSRFTLFVNAMLSSQSFSLVVESNVPVVAERPMYFNFSGGLTGGSAVVGYQPPGTSLPALPLSVYSGSLDGNLYALRASNGMPRWSFPTGGGVSAQAAFTNGVVYAGSFDGFVYALRASDGAALWKFQTRGAVASAPVVANGRVYVGSLDHAVYAVAASTGSQIWRFRTGGAVDAPPAVWEGVVYIGSEDSNVYALDANTGELLWRFQAGAGVQAAPVIANGILYIGSEDGSEYALDASTGELLWKFQAGGQIFWAASVSAGAVYVGALDGAVYALDASTGELLWKFQTGAGILATPAVANDLVYIGSTDTFLYALNANTGAVRWSFQTGAAIESSPAVADGIVVVGSNNGALYALDANTGSMYWSFLTGGGVDADPTIAP